MIDCRLTNTPIDATELLSEFNDPSCGAVAMFIGTARNSSKQSDSEVVRLEYEAYSGMAEAEMESIVKDAVHTYGLHQVLLHHRIGILHPPEPAVVVIVASPHRAAAFDACRFIIEELKTRVPIWKKEVFHNGEYWVHANA